MKELADKLQYFIFSFCKQVERKHPNALRTVWQCPGGIQTVLTERPATAIRDTLKAN